MTQINSNHVPYSAQSSASPEGSEQDTSSDGSRQRKRKTSSDSSPTALFGGDTLMNDDLDMSDWKPDVAMLNIGGDAYALRDPDFSTNSNGVNDIDFGPDLSNKTMMRDFDFENAGSSPSHFAVVDSKSQNQAPMSTQYGRGFQDTGMASAVRFSFTSTGGLLTRS